MTMRKQTKIAGPSIAEQKAAVVNALRTAGFDPKRPPVDDQFPGDERNALQVTGHVSLTFASHRGILYAFAIRDTFEAGRFTGIEESDTMTGAAKIVETVRAMVAAVASEKATA
jgi:hypothetical protein